MAPEQETADKLSKLEGCGLLILYRYPGQVGWIVPHMRQLSEARVGDTIYMDGHPVEPLPGFKPYSPVVYAGKLPFLDVFGHVQTYTRSVSHQPQ